MQSFVFDFMSLAALLSLPAHLLYSGWHRTDCISCTFEDKCIKRNIIKCEGNMSLAHYHYADILIIVICSEFILFLFITFGFSSIHRYGPPNELLELGRVAPGTYCTRQFDECYRKKCRLQSPNYPGMYPRNVTCYWTIRQKVVPTCKHAMVSVSQENEHKALVKRYVLPYDLMHFKHFV